MDALDATKILKSVLTFFEKEKLEGARLSLDNPVKRLCLATGLTYNQVYYLTHERIQNKEKENIKPRSYPTKLDSFDRDVVKRKVEKMFKEGEVVRVEDIKDYVKEELSKEISWDTTRREILACGYRFMNPPTDGNNEKRAKPEIVTWRNDYIRSIMKARSEKKNIIYLDESWVNANHRATKQWVNEDTGNSRKTKSGKGSRWILLEAGGRNGWTGDGLVFQGKHSTEDYHGEMNAIVFEQWYENMLIGLEHPTTIVMDNASYHGRMENHCPSSATKSEIIAFAAKHNISLNPTDTVKRYREILAENKSIIDPHVAIDRMTWHYGHEILRLPPYHSAILNPIEQMWALVKNYIAMNNKVQTLSTVKDLYYQARVRYAHCWQQMEEHVIRAEQRIMTENKITPVMNPVVITFDDDEDEEDLTAEEYEILLAACAVPLVPLEPSEPECIILSQSSSQQSSLLNVTSVSEGVTEL